MLPALQNIFNSAYSNTPIESNLPTENKPILDQNKNFPKSNLFSSIKWNYKQTVSCYCPFNVDLLQLDIRLINHWEKPEQLEAVVWGKNYYLFLVIENKSLNYLLWGKVGSQPLFPQAKDRSWIF